MRKPENLIKAEVLLYNAARFLNVNDKLDFEDLYGLIDDLEKAKTEIKNRIGELKGENV